MENLTSSMINNGGQQQPLPSDGQFDPRINKRAQRETSDRLYSADWSKHTTVTEPITVIGSVMMSSACVWYWTNMLPKHNLKHARTHTHTLVFLPVCGPSLPLGIVSPWAFWGRGLWSISCYDVISLCLIWWSLQVQRRHCALYFLIFNALHSVNLWSLLFVLW